MTRRLSWRFWCFSTTIAFAQAATLAVSFAVPWHLIQQGASASKVTLIVATQLLPYVLSPWLGALVDRFDRWHLLALALAAQAVVAVAMIAALGSDRLGLIVALQVVTGSAAVVSGLVGDYGLLPVLVGPDLLSRANGVHMGLSNLALLGGPAAGGVTIALVGTNGVFVSAGAVYLIAAATILVLRTRGPARTATSAGGVRHAVRWLLGARDLLALTATATLFNLGIGALPVFISFSAQRTWHWSASIVGLVLACAGVASFAGSWIGGRLWERASYLSRYRVWLAVCAAAAFVMGFGWHPWLVVVGFILLCFGEGGMLVLSRTLRQTLIPDELYGRVNAVLRCVMTAAIPVAGLLLGLSLEYGGRLLGGLPIPGFIVIASALSFALLPGSREQVDPVESALTGVE